MLCVGVCKCAYVYTPPRLWCSTSHTRVVRRRHAAVSLQNCDAVLKLLLGVDGQTFQNEEIGHKGAAIIYKYVIRA